MATKSSSFISILSSKKPKHRKLKYCLGFLYGFSLGVGFYELILVDLNFAENVAILVGMFLCTLLGAGCAFSRQVRCIALLSFPNFCGKAGRGVLKAMIVTWLLAGPVNNISHNGHEVARALFGMKTNIHEVKDTIRSVKDLTGPIVKELENEEEMAKLKEENDYMDEVLKDTKRSDEIIAKYNKTNGTSDQYEKKYFKKMEFRCNDQITRSLAKCRRQFEKSYDRCKEEVTWLASWALCWPMKLTFVCNVIEVLGGPKICEPAANLQSGFGDGYTYLKHSKEVLGRDFKEVKLQYQLGDWRKKAGDVRQAGDSAKAIMHEVFAKKQVLDSFLKLIKRILGFFVLKLIVSSQNYHNSYLTDLHFDNIYITRYFKRIDKRRRLADRHNLLPLKRIERMKLIDPLSPRPLSGERQRLVTQTIKLWFEVLITTTFVILDRLFFEALDIIRRHAYIEYEQQGYHDLFIEVKGTGMIAAIIQSVIKNFNVKKRIRIVRDNQACLPQPSQISNYYFYKIYGFYAVIWLMAVVEAYTQRLRFTICAYFYPKREKKRVLFLYNDMLRKRIGYFRRMRRHVKRMVRQQTLENEMSVCAVLRTKYPAFNWLKYLGVARRKCIICQDPERVRGYRRCGNDGCYVVYCAQCWRDIRRRCLACTDTPPDSSGFDSSDFD